MRKNLVQFSLFGLSIVGIYLFLKSNNKLSDFNQLSLTEWLIIIGVAWVIMISTTFLTFKIRLRDENYKLTDLLTYPLVQSLWGYIIPIQGSLLFSITYFKRIYSKSITESISVNLLFIFISLISGGLLGIVTSLLSGIETLLPYLLFTSSFALGTVPFVVNVALLEHFKQKTSNKFFLRFIDRAQFLKRDLNSSISYFRKSPELIFTFIIRILLMLAWYAIIAYSLSYQISLDALLLFIFFSQSSTILKFTPGNWGSQQAVVGVLFGIIGLNPNEAVLISTISMLGTISLSFTIGLFFNFVYLRRFNLHSVFDLIKK